MHPRRATGDILDSRIPPSGGPDTSNEEVHFKPGEYGYSFAG